MTATFWHFILFTTPVITLAATSMLQTWQIVKLSEKINEINRAVHLKNWIEAINNGESPSDIAYMREKGFLK